MNPDIFIKICAYSGLNHLHKFMLINKEYNLLIKKKASMYVIYLSDNDKNELFINSITYNLPYFIDALIQYDLNFEIGIHLAVQFNNISAVKLLLNYVDMEISKKFMLIDSIRYNHTKITKLLLKYEYFDINIFNNYCLRKACENGNIKIVKILLNHKNFKIDKKSLSITKDIAHLHRYYYIVKLLDQVKYYNDI